MRCEAIEDADDRHAGHLLFHTQKKVSHTSKHFLSSIQIGCRFTVFFFRILISDMMTQRLFNYLLKERH